MDETTSNGAKSVLPLHGTPGRGRGRGDGCAQSANRAPRRSSAANPSPLPSPRSTGERETMLRRPRVLWSFIALMIIASPSIVRAVEPTATPGSQRIVVATAHTQFALRVADDGRLYQLGYGKSDERLPEPKKTNRIEEFHPASGDGYINEPAIQAFHADGNTSTDLIYVRHAVERVDDNVSITRIELKDPAYPFFVTLCLKSFANEDMIEQWTEIHHEEASPV